MMIREFQMQKSINLDLIVVLLWPIIASLLEISLEQSNTLHANFLVSIMLFLVVPSVYLSLRDTRYVLKAIIASLIGSVPLMVIVEYFGHASNTWSFPPSVFPVTIFGSVIVEVLVWAFFNVYYVILFYEYFLDHHVTRHLWEPRMKYLLMGLLVAFVIFLFVILKLAVPPIPYFYFFFGIVVFAVPVTLQFSAYSHRKKVLMKMLKTAAYFFYLSFLYEILALQYGWWGFHSDNFVGWISLLGTKFPIEELVWWIMLFALAVLSCYEFFDDDER